MTTWHDVESALQVRSGWKRSGREWHGPCPVTGVGRDTAWAAPGDLAQVRVGCRHCGGDGGRLDRVGVRTHLVALCGGRW